MALLPVTESEHAHSSPTAKTAVSAWSLLRGALVVAILLLLVGALAWFVFGIGTGNFVDSDAKRVVERQKILADRNTEDAKLLHDPASWLAKDKGIVRVPIDRAVEMTIPELQKVEPHPAYPLKQSPPQPANAPTSPDKGADTANAANNPSASNPTVGQPSPAPVVSAPTPAPATSASNAPAAPTPAAPAPSAAPVAPATPAPTPAATAVPAATPMGVPAPSPDNNANNPGNPPVPGTSVQPAAPMPNPAPTAAPATGAQPEPLTAPPAQPTPTGTTTPAAAEATTPTPSVTTPGASPAGTP